jgi:putative DNA primase/helicase
MTLTEDFRKQIKEFAVSHKYEETVGFATVLCPNGDNDAALRFVDFLFKKVVYPYTDMGNSERLYDKYGDIFRWVTERQLFLIWNERAWVYDTPDHTRMIQLAKDTVRAIIQEPDGPGDKAFENKLKWALASESKKRLIDMVSLVKSEGNTTISINDLDKDPYLFNCRNATIDLHTGGTRLHSKHDLITIVAPVDYDASAQCPLWVAFMDQIQSNNKPMIKYLQKLSGYCMTGDTKTDIIPFCHGIGGNGKTTYWEVIRRIMGTYAYEVDPDVFLVNTQKFKDSGQREELANLYGKRLVTATEIQVGRQLTINLLKAISGGESIHGDRKYERGITYKPTFKVILSGNNEPVIRDTTNGAWRRLKKIPFTVTIPNPIDGYEDTFNNELSGILNWLVAGCLLWQKEGLKDPDEVIQATAEYRKDQDLISQFLDESCTRVSEAVITKKDFKAAYLKWCIDSSIKPMDDKELKQRLEVFGIKGDRSTGGLRIWKGVRLLTDHD